MLLSLRSTFEDLRKFDNKYRDHRQDKYFLMSNPWHMFAVLFTYYIFVKHLGPKMMANRKPYDLKWILIAYNLAQVGLNLYFEITSIYLIVVKKPYDNVFCMMPLLGDDPRGHLELGMAYNYFLLKVADLFDTVFFVLRKRHNQVTFLHVYHHLMVSGLGYAVVRYVPGGHLGSFALVNTIVHTIMYFYYFLSALRPELKQSLWWKKYITQIQLVQFVIMLVHYVVPLVRGNCAYPRVLLQMAVTQNIVMIVLFSKFYYQAYIRKPKVTKAVEHQINGGASPKKVQ